MNNNVKLTFLDGQDVYKVITKGSISHISEDLHNNADYQNDIYGNVILDSKKDRYSSNINIKGDIDISDNLKIGSKIKLESIHRFISKLEHQQGRKYTADLNRQAAKGSEYIMNDTDILEGTHVIIREHNHIKVTVAKKPPSTNLNISYKPIFYMTVIGLNTSYDKGKMENSLHLKLIESY